MDASQEFRVEDLPQLPNLQQESHWDCGPTCVRVVVEFLGIDFLDLVTLLKKLQVKKSVWTIDLAYMLMEHGISCHYSTVNMGVDPAYADMAYYRNNLSTDMERVKRLLSEADSRGVSVSESSLSKEELTGKLKSGHVFIALVDWSKLICVHCQQSPIRVAIDCLMKAQCSYQGHYIVLSGYDSEEHLIYFQNPGLAKGVCWTNYQNFDDAWRTKGTDEDLICIPLNQQRSVGLGEQQQAGRGDKESGESNSKKPGDDPLSAPVVDSS